MGYSKKQMPIGSIGPCSKSDYRDVVDGHPSPKASNSSPSHSQSQVTPVTRQGDEHHPRQKREPLDKAALDAKYSKPELLGKFVCYFGMHKGKTFEEILRTTPSYADFCMRMEPKTNCMYLFQRYITAIRSSSA